MNLAIAEDLAVKLINEHLVGWNFAWNNLVRVNGVCNYGKKTIYLSKCLNETRHPQEVRATIVHEIAHALNPKDGHGAAWRKTCLALGGTGKKRGEGGERPAYTWVMEHNGEFVKGYYRKPTVALRNLATTFLVGREEETVGKLEIRKVA